MRIVILSIIISFTTWILFGQVFNIEHYSIANGLINRLYWEFGGYFVCILFYPILFLISRLVGISDRENGDVLNTPLEGTPE